MCGLRCILHWPAGASQSSFPQERSWASVLSNREHPKTLSTLGINKQEKQHKRKLNERGHFQRERASPERKLPKENCAVLAVLSLKMPALVEFALVLLFLFIYPKGGRRRCTLLLNSRRFCDARKPPVQRRRAWKPTPLTTGSAVPGNSSVHAQAANTRAQCLKTDAAHISHHGRGAVPGNGHSHSNGIPHDTHMPSTPGRSAWKPRPLTTSRHGKGAAPGNRHRPTRATHSTAQCLETNTAHHWQRSAWKWTPSHTCHPCNGAVPGNGHRPTQAAH